MAKGGSGLKITQEVLDAVDDVKADNSETNWCVCVCVCVCSRMWRLFLLCVCSMCFCVFKCVCV